MEYMYMYHTSTFDEIACCIIYSVLNQLKEHIGQIITLVMSPYCTLVQCAQTYQRKLLM